MQKIMLALSFLYFGFPNAVQGVVSDSASCFIIKVIDLETSRGIPMVELTTTSKIRYYTDSNGIICFDESTLMNQVVYFDIFSHGYQSPDNGVYLNTVPGTQTTIGIKRLNIAERLYRITGQDIYGGSVKGGLFIPVRRQALNGKVTGQDTFIETLYRGRIYWFWGDTFGPASFNGHVSGAISDLPGKGGLDPGIGVELNYFVDSSGLNKPMCDIPGPGLVWIDWLATLKDEDGTERLFAKYTRTKNLDVAYERGIAVFDDSLRIFKSINQIEKWLDKVHSSGHPVRISANGRQYFYIFDRYGLERVPADPKKILDAGSYEHFTCLESGSKFSTLVKIERTDSKNIVYGWKAHSDPVSTRQQYRLMEEGRLADHEGWFNPLDVTTGKKLLLEPASVFWNAFRQRWVMIAYEFCGQVWFLEADTPTGPWVYARKILAHDHYNFYNVGQHPLFDQDNGRIIYFEGTYTNSFSGNPYPTPLYDYNQIMYRLRLDDERLFLPVPVYQIRCEDGEALLLGTSVDSLGLWESVISIPFFAMPPGSPDPAATPVFYANSGSSTMLTTTPQAESSGPVFLGRPLSPMPKAQRDPVSGTWNCTAVMPDGSKEAFEIVLENDRGIVTGPDVSAGYYRDDTLDLTLQIFDYLLEARLKEASITGTYQKEDGSESGYWSGVRTGLPEDDPPSPDLVLLFEYQKKGGKERFYSVDPDLSDETWTRTPEPLCRVWRNPSSILALDHTARPLPLRN